MLDKRISPTQFGGRARHGCNLQLLRIAEMLQHHRLKSSYSNRAKRNTPNNNVCLVMMVADLRTSIHKIIIVKIMTF